MGDTLERATGIALTVCAITITGIFAYRSLVVTRRPPGASREQAPVGFVDDWREAADIGFALGGPDSGGVTILELTDLECPACRGFHETVEEILSERTDVQLIYVPHPLSYHRFAMPAPRAAECAYDIGALQRWISVVFSEQDSLGLKSWGQLAEEAGIADTAQIALCARQAGVTPRIQAGLDFGSRIGMAGTPTVLINGWQFEGVPSRGQLNSAIRKVLRGEPPH